MEIMTLKSHLQELESSLSTLAGHIRNTPNLFIAKSPGVFHVGDSAISLACSSITDLYYADGIEDGRFTSICLGGIALDASGLTQAIAVNLAKDSFHKACKVVMDNARGKGYLKLSAAGKAKRLRAVLIEAGYPRLSLRQCFRHIPVLHHTPVDIRFSFSSGGRSIRKITPEQALALLLKKDFESEQAKIDIETISNLLPGTALAQVQDLPGYYKANVWHDLEADPHTIPAFLPIIYPHCEDRMPKRPGSLPEADAGKRLRRKKIRSDKKLSDTALVTSIRVYAYKNS